MKSPMIPTARLQWKSDLSEPDASCDAGRDALSRGAEHAV